MQGLRKLIKGSGHLKYNSVKLNPLFQGYGVLTLIFLFLSGLPAFAELNCQYNITQPVNNPKEKYKKGYCLITLGKFQEGISILNGLQSQLPSISDHVIYYQAIGHKGMGNLEIGKTLFNSILSAYPSTGLKERTLMGLGDIYLATRKYEMAENVFRSLFNGETDREEKAFYLNKLGDSLQSQGKYLDALNTYKSLWVEFPDSIFADVAFNNAGYISSKHGIPFTVSEMDYLQRAEIFFDNSMWGSCLEDFYKVSKTPDVKTKMAIALVNLGRLDDASNLLAQVNSPESLLWMGKVSSKLGKDHDAAETYKQIQIFYPQNPLAPEGLYNAARLYQINNDLNMAISTYEELIRKYPNSEFAEDGAWNLGWIYYKRRKLTDALATFSAFTNSSVPFNSSNNKYWKARVLEKQGKRSEAFANYEELARSQTPTYHSYLAQIKTGLKPNFGVFSPQAYAQSASNSSRIHKVDLLSELEMFDDASLEIERMHQESKSDNDLIQVSFLYASVDDFYNSVKIAEGLSSSAAISLSYPRAYREIVKAYSNRYNVDEYLVYSIMREESRFQKDAVSPANAIGLMQLLPSTAGITASEVGISGFNTEMLNIPRVNIELGIYYLKKVLGQFNGDIHLALASYNAGPQRAEDWIITFPNLSKDEFVEEIPFRETRNYIRRILRSYGAYKAIYN